MDKLMLSVDPTQSSNVQINLETLNSLDRLTQIHNLCIRVIDQTSCFVRETPILVILYDCTYELRDRTSRRLAPCCTVQGPEPTVTLLLGPGISERSLRGLVHIFAIHPAAM